MYVHVGKQNVDRVAKICGQNRKDNSGGYSGETARLILKHIQYTAPESFLPAEDSAPQYESKPLISHRFVAWS